MASPDTEKAQTTPPESPNDEKEVKWDGNNDGTTDPMCPRSRSKPWRWMMVLIVSMASACVTCTSSLYTFTFEQITVEFHCSRLVATLGLSLFVIGLGVGPMVLAPLSEYFYGRRPIYNISLLLFTIWFLPCALARNIETMLIGRFFNGVAGSAFLSVAGGTVGDLFTSDELLAPMMVYTASPFMGPSIGPIIGGAINYYVSWRWSFWMLMIWSGILTLVVFFFVPETYHPVLLKQKAKKLRKETGDKSHVAALDKDTRSITRTILTSCMRPFQLLFYEPMVLNLCLFCALLLGILYLFFGAFPLVFGNNHDFNLWQVGLTFWGILIGMILGVLSEPYWHKRQKALTKKHIANGTEAIEPEDRLLPAVLGGPLVAIGLFWFAWTTYRSVHWILPIIGSAIFGLGNILVFSGVFTFLVGCYPMYAASAMAANSFTRSSFAAAFPLFGVQMYEKLGYQWASSVLAFLAVALAPFPWLFYKYGKTIRKRSRYAKPT